MEAQSNVALVKWIPYKDLLFLQDRMSRIFDDALSRYVGEGIDGQCTWSPPADILETEDKVVLKVEVAGIDIKDINLEINDNVLTLRGERCLKRDVEDEDYHVMECSYGTFQRVFTLSSKIDKKKTKASLKDGVLEILVPKVKKKKPKLLKVEVK
jgi:HSP20 family protein